MKKTTAIVMMVAVFMFSKRFKNEYYVHFVFLSLNILAASPIVARTL